MSRASEARERRRRRREQLTPDQRADRLKERVYVTFAALAVVLALRGHVEGLEAGRAALTLVITVGGTLLAVFLADFVSHVVVHGALPTRAERRHMLGVVSSAGGVVVLPLVFLWLAGRGAWTVAGALTASTVALIVSLGLVGYVAVRVVALPWWQKWLLLLTEVALGLAVVGLEVLAHG
ncbi:hypothetical protein [Isoptericola sp. NPDC057653]|jgi:hypothetical protein|uniref:hypothetical protein n=1 Tax=unclassified Isoptericola TaxID=2623355 RepID=UPI0036C35C70